MASEDVRVIGTVAGAHGMELPVGTDHGAVTIAGVQLDVFARVEFMRLWLDAIKDAFAWSVEHTDEVPGDGD